MALVCARALASAARKGLFWSHSSATKYKNCWVLCFGSDLFRCYRWNSSISSLPFTSRLSEEPNSRIKSTLDAEMDAEFSWNALLTSLSTLSPQKVQLVLERRLEKMLEEEERNPTCYSELITMCGKIKNVQLAMLVFTSMETLRIKPISGTFNALVSACLFSSDLMTALSLFEVMERSDGYKPNSETYNIFILAYSNLGNEKAMQTWYTAQKAAGFSADLHTFESLISCFCKSKNFDAVDRVYEELLLAGVAPNVLILEKVLAGLCKRGSLVKAKEFLKFVVDGGWKINEAMAEDLVGLFYNLGGVEEMEELLATLVKSNQVPEVLSVVHYGMIRIYAKLDRLDDVEYSVGRMLRQGISFNFPEDVDKVICLYFKRTAYERLELFLEFIEQNYKFTRSNYDLLVAGYRRAGMSTKLDKVMNEMELAGFL